MTETTFLNVENLSKRFPGVQALNNISFGAAKGEVLGLVGANGAGKSTLMNVLGGLIQADEGTISLGGRSVRIKNPRSAEDFGIAFIHQEIQLFSDLRVFENILIADLHKWRKGRFLPLLDVSALRAQSKTYLEMLGSEINPNRKVDDLVVGEQQMVQIARALSQGGKILLFDEPTSSLSSKEKAKLYGVIRKLKSAQLVILYITHFLDEVFEICDRLVVLRDGEVAGTGSMKELDKRAIIGYMIGREIEPSSAENQRRIGDEVLRVEGVGGRKLPRDVSFSLRDREVLGIWGLMGSGRTELIRVLLGFDKLKKGQISVKKGGVLEKTKPSKLARMVGYVTEGRHHDGLYLNMPIWQNISSASLKMFATRLIGVLRNRKERLEAQKYMERVNVVAASEQSLVSHLSGGNQQKVILAKWFLREPAIMFMDEPTKGVDVGAKADLQKRILDEARAGTAFVVVSSELEEMMILCDRIIVLQRGEIVEEYSRAEFSKDRLMDSIIMRDD